MLTTLPMDQLNGTADQMSVVLAERSAGDSDFLRSHFRFSNGVELNLT